MPGEAARSTLSFFLDRGLGSRIVPEALREAGWILETMDERYGKEHSQKIQDSKWIEETTLGGEILLCKDLAVAHNDLEAQVAYMSAARIFALANARVTGPEMADLYLKNEDKIVRHALRVSGPYVMAISTATSLRRVKLAFPS